MSFATLAALESWFGLDLQTFREALAVMQRQVEELDQLKIKHYQAIMDHEAEVWDGVAGTVCPIFVSTTFPNAE